MSSALKCSVFLTHAASASQKPALASSAHSSSPGRSVAGAAAGAAGGGGATGGLAAPRLSSCIAAP